MSQKAEVQPLQIDCPDKDDEQEVITVVTSHKDRSAPFMHYSPFIQIAFIVCVSVSFLFLGHHIHKEAEQGGPVATTGEIDSNARTSQNPRPTYTVHKENGTMFQTLGDTLLHDKHHFTQGLTYSRSSNMLFESNGLFGRSTVCKLNPDTGETILCKDMDKRFFAEGMQVYGDPGHEKLIQITWKSRVGFIYSAETLEVMSNFTFSTQRNEGWGICYDAINHEFIVSDGSEYLHFWDADSLEEKRRVSVIRQNGQRAVNMNELEFVDGKVLANVWYEDVILVIDPISGKCQSEYDMSLLWSTNDRAKNGANVLNGISISQQEGVLYITGKNWDRMFRVKLEGF